MHNTNLPGRRPATRAARGLAGAALAGSILVGGCQTLDVVNQNSPAIEGVFSNAENIESALVGGWRNFYGVDMGTETATNLPLNSPSLELSVLGNELTTGDAFPMQVTQEPRVAIDNRNQGGWYNRKPWYNLYRVIATGRDVIQSIDAGNLRLGDVTATCPTGCDTPRAKIFAKFLIGVGNVYLGLMFDQGFPANENDLPDGYDYTLQPYTALLEQGRASLREAIAEAKAANDFSTPVTWINGVSYSRDDLVRIMYSYLARSYAYAPRNPTERAAVNWQQVIGLVDSGITSNFNQQADNTIVATRSTYIQFSALQTNGRINNRLIGPADTTGAYQAWLQTPLEQRDAFLVGTPDRRISNAFVSTNANPPAPAIIARPTSQTMPTARGTYMRSNYLGTKHRNPPALNFWSTGLYASMTTEEMKFLRIEALFRLNRRAEVLPLLNPSRVAAGLKPVTVDGPPAGGDCVPRKDNGTCGDLWDAIMYEKRMQTFATNALMAFSDQRGWGRLLSGTPLHFPVHGRELETLRLPYYTTGGGGEGSAP
jgi:hypothetical protein